MINIQLLCVGKLKEPFYTAAAAEYAKRLSAYCRLGLVEVPEERLPKDPSPAQIEEALAREAKLILAHCPARSSLIALCIEGRQRSSEELAQLLHTWSNRGERQLSFVIGGSYGLHAAVKSAAWVQLSMSPMTFPHHLARVMLLEQIYRGFKINEGSRYHK